jgi:hypothetical protein
VERAPGAEQFVGQPGRVRPGQHEVVGNPGLAGAGAGGGAGAGAGAGVVKTVEGSS